MSANPSSRATPPSRPPMQRSPHRPTDLCISAELRERKLAIRRQHIRKRETFAATDRTPLLRPTEAPNRKSAFLSDHRCKTAAAAPRRTGTFYCLPTAPCPMRRRINNQSNLPCLLRGAKGGEENFNFYLSSLRGAVEREVGRLRQP